MAFSTKIAAMKIRMAISAAMVFPGFEIWPGSS
jgi:hypothetical protein